MKSKQNLMYGKNVVSMDTDEFATWLNDAADAGMTEKQITHTIDRHCNAVLEALNVLEEQEE